MPNNQEISSVKITSGGELVSSEDSDSYIGNDRDLVEIYQSINDQLETFRRNGNIASVLGTSSAVAGVSSAMLAHYVVLAGLTSLGPLGAVAGLGGAVTAFVLQKQRDERVFQWTERLTRLGESSFVGDRKAALLSLLDEVSAANAK
jgi:hypothetical protein